MPIHPGQSRSMDLPAEVLLYIFQFFVGPRRENGHDPNDEEAFERRERPMTLSHTCSWWRCLALSSPSLWTDVLIDGDEELWFSYVERSRPLRADLTIIADRGLMQRSRVAGLLHRKFAESRVDLCRIRSITLLVGFGQGEAAEMLRPFYPISGDLNPNPLPSLLALDIRALRHYDRQGPGHRAHDPSNIFPGPLKALESISLTRICHKCVPNLDTLRTLEIRKTWGYLLVSSQVLRDIFEYSPQLDTLILGPIEAQQWGDADGELILAPSLKNLIIAWPSSPRQWNPTEEMSPLDDLVAENLEYLEVVCPTLEAIDYLQTIIFRRLAQEEESRPLTLMISGLALLSHHEYFEQFRTYLPIHIRPALNLWVYQRYMLQMEAAQYQDLSESALELRSFLLYFDAESESGKHSLACVPGEMRQLQCRRGLTPVVIHAATDDTDPSLVGGMKIDARWPHFAAASDLVKEP